MTTPLTPLGPEGRDELRRLAKEHSALLASWGDEIVALLDERDRLAAHVEELANVIMFEVDGEPSRSEGAVECAIRLVRERDRLAAELDASRGATDATAALVRAQKLQLDTLRTDVETADAGNALLGTRCQELQRELDALRTAIDGVLNCEPFQLISRALHDALVHLAAVARGGKQ